MDFLRRIFEGRLGRWHYFLGIILIYAVESYISLIIFPNYLYILYVLILLTLPLTVRRLHDLNLSGFWTPLTFIAVINGTSFGIFMLAGMIINLALTFTRGSKDKNRYGDVPKPGRRFLDAILNRESKESNKKLHVVFKVIIWILAITILSIVSVVIQDIRGSQIRNTIDNTTNKSIVLYADQVSAPGFTRYSLTEDGLSADFPQVPEKQEIEVNVDEFKKIRYYTALSKDESVRYLVMVAILDQDILSQESIDAWLKNLLESKIANHKNPEIKDDQYVQFKGMKSRLYSFTSIDESGDTIKYQTIAFVYNGKPFEFEVVYPVDYSGNLYWDEFIESIESK